MSQVTEECQVQPVEVRTIPGWHRITGFVAGGRGPEVTRLVAEVRSLMPDEYQSDLDPFRKAINSTIHIRARRQVSSTQRGVKHWWEVVEVPAQDTIYLDVTECNHIPNPVRGWRDCEAGCGSIRAYWSAYLVSVERIDEGDPKRPSRTVAGYFAMLDASEGAT